MWKAIARDPLVRIVVLAALVVWVPLALPFAPAPRYGLWFALQSITLVLGIGACLWRLERRPSPTERRFWRALAAALASWFAYHVLEFSVQGDWASDLRVSVLGDFLLALVYLFSILALEQRPHAGSGQVPPGRVRALACAGAAILALGLFAYFPAIPAVFESELYLSWSSSYAFYSILDAYLLLRLLSLVSSVETPRWRAIYGCLLVSALLWAGLDGMELLANLGLVAQPISESLIQNLWFLSPLLIALTARLRDLPFAEPPTPLAQDLFHALWGGPFLINAFFFLLVHVGTQVVTGPLPTVEIPREIVLSLAVLSLLSLAFYFERLLARDHARLAGEREAMTERAKLAQRMEAIGRFAGGVAHDFNNLLQVIRVCSENLIEDLGPRSPQRPHAEEIALAAEKAARLTDRLLYFAHERSIQPTALDLNEVVAHTTGMLRRIIGDDIVVRLQLDPRAGTVLADRDQLERVLLNLGVNARDAMPQGGTILVETALVRRPAEGAAPRQFAVLSMKDSGVGMDAATRARIFDPFFTTKKDGRGTGLGLTMIRAFVSASRGEIEVESAPGSGATFRILLPAVEGASAPQSQSAGRAELEGSAGVLVVEDERAVRSVICGLLQASGFRVLEAADGETALDVLERAAPPPDMVLTDLIMPRMGGAELAARIRALRPGLPIAFMTGYSGGELRREGLEGIRVLQKPFSRDSLAQAMRECLGNASPGGDPRAASEASAADPERGISMRV